MGIVVWGFMVWSALHEEKLKLKDIREEKWRIGALASWPQVTSPQYVGFWGTSGPVFSDWPPVHGFLGTSRLIIKH
jgi:hypothetical protein